MTPVRWGVLATGTIARTFADALDACPAGTLAAVASRSADRAEAFVADRAPAHDAGRRSVRAGRAPADDAGRRSVRAHGSYAALLADPDVDAVYVATPHTEHAAWTLRALAAGKAVLCEKPLGVNHPEVLAMVDAAETGGRFLMEAFMYRCHPQTRALVALIRDGAIGEVRHVSASFGYQAPFDPASRLFANALAGGGILDVGCYPVSAARLVADSEPERVTANGRLGRTGVDEWSAALLHFENGVSAHVATAVSLALDNTLDVFGSAGSIHVARPWLPGARWAFELCRTGREPETVSGDAEPLYALEAAHVAECLAGGRVQSDLVSWQDSLGNARALDAWRSAIGLEFEHEQPARHRGPLLGGTVRPRADAPMRHAALPGLPKPVSRLVMGCDNQPNMSHAAVMWDHYVEQGGNTFDTAYVYGRGRMEELLGWWHSHRGVREAMTFIVKGAHTPDDRPERVAPQLTESLERLRTDHADVYFLHRDNPEVPVGEFVTALNDEVRRGRITVFGGSNWTLERLREANRYAADNRLQGFCAVSNNLSLARMVNPIWPGVQTAHAVEFRAFLEESGLALFPWSSQARGFFTPWADAVIADRGRENPVITTMQPTIAELERTWFSDDNFARRERAAELAAQRGVDLITMALAWVLSQPYACFPLIGPRTPAETRHALRALDVPLTAAERAWLNLESDTAQAPP